MSVELRHLRAFLAVAADLNFTAASARLHMTQQGLSRVVQQLERETGVRLLERTTRSVSLTPAGHALVPAARRALAAADRAVLAAREAHAGLGPSLRVEVSSSGLRTSALVLRRFRADHPEIAVHEVELGPEAAVAALSSGSLDVLFSLVPGGTEDLLVAPVHRERVLVGLAADHPLARLRAVPLARLAGEALLLPSRETDRLWVDIVTAACRSAGFTPTRWPGVTRGSLAAADVVREGRCVVPTVAWAHQAPGVVFRPLAEPGLVSTWSSAVRAEDRERPEIRAFLATIAAVATEQGWS